MKIGDKLRVSERTGKSKEISVQEGSIILITNRTITILKEKHGNEIRESFSLGDLVTEQKKYHLNTGEKWEEICFRQEGQKITDYKVVRKNG